MNMRVTKEHRYADSNDLATARRDLESVGKGEHSTSNSGTTASTTTNGTNADCRQCKKMAGGRTRQKRLVWRMPFLLLGKIWSGGLLDLVTLMHWSRVGICPEQRP